MREGNHVTATQRHAVPDLEGAGTGSAGAAEGMPEGTDADGIRIAGAGNSPENIEY